MLCDIAVDSFKLFDKNINKFSEKYHEILFFIAIAVTLQRKKGISSR
jgi:hypothetical protein